MKKLILFLGLIFCCILFSCKKDASNNVPIETLPIPLTNGTWWKYLRIDTSQGQLTPRYDSSIEVITVKAKTSFDMGTTAPVESILLEVKNLTKGTIDSNYVVYNDTAFNIYKGNLLLPYLSIKLPQTDTELNAGQVLVLSFYVITVKTVLHNTSINVFDKLYSSCTLTETQGAHYYSSVDRWDYQSKTFLKPQLGFVYWKSQNEYHTHYPTNSNWFVRRLMDYYIAP